MGKRVLGILAIGLMFVVCPRPANGDAKDDAVKKELENLKGTWRVVSREEDGKKMDEKEAKEMSDVYDADGKAKLYKGDKIRLEVAWKLDPTKKPKTVDSTFLAGDDKGKTRQGIYELDGDMLKMCFAPIGKDRPTEFSSKGGNLLIVEKREKR